MFQVKSFNAITASIINNIRQGTDEITDFNVGSVARTLAEAHAREIAQLYQALLKGLLEAIPVAIYKSFAFGRLPAAAASGYVTFTRAAGNTTTITIPAGTMVKVPGVERYYTVNQDYSLASGADTINVYVVATVPGVNGNVATGSITELVNPVSGIASISNGNAFTNGRDVESDSERKIRFQEYIASLSRATPDSLAYGAKTASLKDANGLVTERVVDAVVYEPHTAGGTLGYVDIYIWNGVAGASAELITETTSVITGFTDAAGDRVPGWKGAGVIARVYAVSPLPVTVTGVITCKTGYTYADMAAAVTEKIDAYFTDLAIGETVIRSKIISAAMSVPGVLDFSLSAPAANTVVDWDRIALRGTLALSEG